MMVRLVGTWLMTASLLVLPITPVFSKDKHCVLASDFIDGNNFIGATGHRFVHLSTTIGGDPGTLLYVLPQPDIEDHKVKEGFYYVESMTSSCIGWTMILRDDDGNDAVLMGSPPPARCQKNRKSSGCEQMAVYIVWNRRDGYGYWREKINFKPTELARLQGLDNSIRASEAEQIIAKTTNAICSKVLSAEPDFEHSDIFLISCISLNSFGIFSVSDMFSLIFLQTSAWLVPSNPG
jgi:hypothetical protein